MAPGIKRLSSADGQVLVVLMDKLLLAFGPKKADEEKIIGAILALTGDFKLDSQTMKLLSDLEAGLTLMPALLAAEQMIKATSTNFC